MPETPDVNKLQEQIFELVKRSQESVLDAGRSLTDSVSDLTPADTAAVDDLIDRVFDLTERVLAAQRDLAKQVVQTVTRPVAGDDDTASTDD